MEINSRSEEIEDFAEVLRRKLDEHFTSMSKPILKNMAEAIIALVILFRLTKGWYGRMTLSGIARCMKTNGRVKIRYKRLDRFLGNEKFQINDTFLGLLHLMREKKSKGFLPTLIDQTAVGDVQVILASFPHEGRSIPVALETFEYGKIGFSQNQIEKDFFVRLQKTLGEENRLLFIMDRGYANVKYIADFNESELLHIIRGCGNVRVEYREKGKCYRTGLGRLPHRQGEAKRYTNVLYHGQQKVLVDIIVYRERGFKEPWFLVVPPESEEILSTEEVVEWYRCRMKIEVTFRDFKSLLGVRGLRLEVNKAKKIGRLLICLAIAYALMIAMGDSDLGRQFRKQIEVLRKRRRHGTRRTLSVLSIALYMATDSFLLTLPHFMSMLASILSSSTNGLCFVT